MCSERRTHRVSLATVGVLALIGTLAIPSFAYAAQAPVDLGTVATYSVIAGSTVTNTGPSVLSGDVGVSPGTAITGFFPPGVYAGVEHAADAQAAKAKSDLQIAYTDARGRKPPTAIAAGIGTKTLKAGVYKAVSALALNGDLTLDGEDTVGAVFIFQVPSQLTTASNSNVRLINGADACNVYWQIGSSATLGTDTTFVGTIMAQQSISVNTGTVIQGRALALTGAVTLDTNVFRSAACRRSQPTPTVTTTATVSVTPPPVTVTSPGPTTVSTFPTKVVTSPGPTTTTTTTSVFPTHTVVNTVTRTGPTSTVTVAAGAGGVSTTRSATSGGIATNGNGRLASTGASSLLAPIAGGAILLTVAGILLLFRGRPKSRHS